MQPWIPKASYTIKRRKRRENSVLSKTAQVIIAITVILILIIGISFFAKTILTESSRRLVNYIERIESSAKSDNWEETEQAIAEIENDWSRTQKVWAMLIDHMEIDNINTTMSRMIRFLKLREKSMALSEASVLRQFIEHIPEKIEFNFENIF